MTYYQIAALLLAGPLGLMMLAHLIRALTGGDFHLSQAILLFVCVVAIAVSFLGVR